MGKDDIRSQILREAGPIFASAGYQQTTVRRICEAAGVNLAAVNYYFGDKERLYIEAVKHARNLIEQRWPLPEWPEAMGYDERLRKLVEVFVHRLLGAESEDWRMQLILREIFQPTRACEEMVQDGFRPFLTNLLSILRGLSSNAVTDHQLHQLAFSIIGQCVFYRAHYRVVGMIIDTEQRDRHFTPPQLAAHIYQFSLAGVAAISAASGSGIQPFSTLDNQP